MNAIEAYAVAATERSYALKSVTRAEEKMRHLADAVRAELSVGGSPIACNLDDNHQAVVGLTPDDELEVLLWRGYSS